MTLILTNFVLLLMLFSLKMNITFLPMFNPYLSSVFFLVMMNCLLLNGSNLKLSILNINQLYPFLSLVLSPHLI